MQGAWATAFRITVYSATLVALTVFAIPRFFRAGAINRWSLYYASQVIESKSAQDSQAPPAQHPRAVLWQAVTALKAGDGFKARQLLGPLVTGGNRYALQLMACTLELLGDFPGSVEAWTLAKDAPSLWKAADRASARSAPNDALLALRAAWELDPENGTKPLADFLGSKQRDYAAGESLLEQALASIPSSYYRLDWLHDLAELLTAQHKWVQAAEAYRQVLAINGNNIEAHIGLGFVDYEQTGAEAAFAEFRKATAIDPRRGDGYLAIAQILVRENRYAQAIPWFDLALERNPRSRWYLVYAGAARKAGELSRALDIYGQAVARFPSYAPAHFEMAWACRLNNQPEQAVLSIERALELMDIPDPAYYVRAGRIYEFAGNPAKAIPAYRQALALDPASEPARQALARLLSAP